MSNLIGGMLIGAIIGLGAGLIIAAPIAVSAVCR